MLRSACLLCRPILLSNPAESAAGPAAVQYAACSLVTAVSGRRPVPALTASKGMSAAARAEGLVIDETAVRHLKVLQAESPDKPLLLRVEVEGGGCSGFQYKFRLDDQQAADDIVFERDGVRVVCDNVSLDFLKGAVVEFEDSLMRSAFQIASNPNSESTCGCGTSFSAKM